MIEVKRTLVVGLRNADFGDYGIGPRTRILTDRINQPDITIAETNYAGLDFLYFPAECGKAIVVDVFNSPCGNVGRYYRVLPEIPASPSNWSPHSIDGIRATIKGKP